MKLKYLIAVFVIFGFLGIGQAYSEKSSNLKTLVELSQRGQYGRVADVFSKLNDKEQDELAEIMFANSPVIEPLYFIALADHIYQTDKDKAVLSFFIGYSRATQDVMACKDKTSRSQLRIYPELAYDTVQYAVNKFEEDKSYKKNLKKNVQAWDKAHPKRTSPIWACYHGMNAFYQKPELVSERKIKSLRKRNYGF